jgi:hypothetical protein
LNERLKAGDGGGGDDGGDCQNHHQFNKSKTVLLHATTCYYCDCQDGFSVCYRANVLRKQFCDERHILATNGLNINQVSKWWFPRRFRQYYDKQIKTDSYGYIARWDLSALLT